MIFASPSFFVFLPIVLFIYHVLRRRQHKYTFLLLASWLFYTWWSAWYIWVILCITVGDYWIARKIEDATTDRQRRRWLWLGIVFSLGLLAYFKYTAFVVGNALSLARLFGFEVPDLVINIALPLGISFHTFQGIGYLIDVYRKQVPAVRSFVDFALFVAFFPQLVAGPIVRPSEFLPQMVTPPKVTSVHIVEGIHWFVIGLFKKMIIADHLQVFVKTVFDQPLLFDAATHRWAVLAWAAQIYCDFSGYSDMAVGCAKWFGFDLPRNFNFPYLATSVTDFWRRWHMTLSTWLRDYLYFPLGGSRLGAARTYFNLMLTFVLCGLWHGASWNWLLYGAYMGLLMCLHRALVLHFEGRRWADRLRATSLWQVLSVLGTFWLLLFGLVFVRMTGWEGCWLMQRSLLGVHHDGGRLAVPIWVPVLVVLVALGHAWSGLRDRRCSILELPEPVRAAVYVCVLAIIVTMNPGVEKPFVYFAF